MPFQIVRNDITKMQVDAIVNTANPMPVYGAGTDTAVYEAAGREKLLEERMKIGIIERGTSNITDGYDLPAKYIIHTVGIAWQGGNSGEEGIIRSCYRSVFKVAVDNGIQSLAIPLLASGSYGFPKGIALRIALSEIESFMSGSDMDVYLVVFDEKSFSLSTELYGDIDEYINDNYVEKKEREEYPDSYTENRKPWQRQTSFSFTGAAFEPSERLPRFLKTDRGAIKKRKAEARAKEAFVEIPDQTESVSESICLPEPGQAAGQALGKAADQALGKAANQAFGKAADQALGQTAGQALAQAAGNQRTLEDVVKNLDKTFMELVFSFADAKGFSDVEVQKKANLDRKAFSKLKCGTTKNPSKSTALALAVALELDLDDTKDLLSRAGLALSPCSKQDVIVQYFIEKEVYDIYEINVALFEHGEQLLGCQAS